MSDLSRGWRLAPRICAAASVVAGAVVLGSWWLGLDTPRSLLPGFPTMKANTALSFILLGVALGLVGSARQTRARRGVVAALASSVVLLATLTLLEYVLDVSLGIDTLLADDPTSPYTHARGRMSPVTATVFVLQALALLVIDTRAHEVRVVSQTAVHASGALLLLVAAGFLFDALVLTGVTSFTTGMAIPTLLLFFVVGTGILAARPDRGIARLLADPATGGVLAWRLLPVSLLLPFAVGWLVWIGEGIFGYPTGFAFSLATVAIAVLLIGATWSAITRIARAEEARERAMRNLEEARGQLEARVAERTGELAAANEELRRGSVRRDLAARVLAIGHRDLSFAARRELGRSLASEGPAASLADAVAALAEMGVGRVEIVRDSPGRFEFKSEDMLEVVPRARTPTCALALGFLEGAAAKQDSAPALGVEVRCRSQGHPACEFVVRAKGIEVPRALVS